MRRPRVSILSPTYNHEAFLAECLQSALDQSVGDWEMILIDDGSDDGTPDVVAGFRDRRIIFVRQEHRGPDAIGETYNRALELSRGPLITILEGDDFWPTDRLQRQLAHFDDPSRVLSHGPARILEDGGEEIVASPFGEPIRTNSPTGSSLSAFLVGFNPVWAQGVMVRRGALERIGGFRQPRGLYLVDFPTWMELALLGPFGYLDGPPLGNWRRHRASITTRFRPELQLGFARYCEQFARLHASDLERIPIPVRALRRSLGVYSFFGLGQQALKEGSFNLARQCFFKTWRRRAVLNRFNRLHALSGIVSSYIHADLYPMLKSLHRALRGPPPEPPAFIEPIAVRR